MRFTDCICEVCGNLIEDCECEDKEEQDEPIDFGDNEWVHGYDGDSL
jgi:hypothetical protein